MSRDLLIRGIAEEVLKELGHQAVEKGVSRSELIRIILEKEVEKNVNLEGCKPSK